MQPADPYQLDGLSDVLLLLVSPYNRTGQGTGEEDTRNRRSDCRFGVWERQVLKETERGGSEGRKEAL